MMTPELTALALTGLLQAALFALYAIPANLELTPTYTSGPRDQPPKPPDVGENRPAATRPEQLV